MPVQAFLDDSGTGVPVFILSGYVSGVEYWESFSKAWQEELSKSPKLAYFKMREAATLSGEFRRMKIEDRNRRIRRLFRLMRVFCNAGISIIIPIRSYNRILKGHTKKEWDDPYFLALFDAVKVLVQNQANAKPPLPPPEPVDFFFDDNPRLAAKVPEPYHLVRGLLAPHHRRFMGASPRFVDDKDFPPLQAADAQSWYFRRLFAEKLQREPFSKHMRKELFIDLDQIPLIVSFWNSELMEEVAGKKPRYRGPTRLRRFRDIHDVIANANVG